MPSAEHESPVALAKLDPDLVAWLLMNLFDVKVPDYHHARPHATDVRVLVPRTYHADGMVLFCDPVDRPLLAAVLEVQRSRDQDKQRTWKLYLAQLEAELDIAAALIVFCPDPAVARWYRSRMTLCSLGCRSRPGPVGRSSWPPLSRSTAASCCVTSPPSMRSAARHAARGGLC
jgi:hypothetical protein